MKMTFKDKFIVFIAVASAIALIAVNNHYDAKAGVIVECGVTISC